MAAQLLILELHSDISAVLGTHLKEILVLTKIYRLRTNLNFYKLLTTNLKHRYYFEIKFE